MRKVVNRKDGSCMYELSENEQLVIHSDYDSDELGCLSIIRHFCASFVPDGNEGWINGFNAAAAMWGEADGPIIAYRLMHVMHAMRLSRTSIFFFQPQDCAICSQILTEHEKRLVDSIRYVRQNRPERASLQLMLLCEGGKTSDTMHKMVALADALVAAKVNASAARRDRSVYH